MSKPLTTADLADALACFNNAALSHMHTCGTPASAFDTVAAIVSGVNAVQFRLEEIDAAHKKQEMHHANLQTVMSYPFLVLKDHREWFERVATATDPYAMSQELVQFVNDYNDQRQNIVAPSGTITGCWVHKRNPHTVFEPTKYFLHAHSEHPSEIDAERQAKRSGAVHWIVRQHSTNPRVWTLYHLKAWSKPGPFPQDPFKMTPPEIAALEDRAHKALVDGIVNDG